MEFLRMTVTLSENTVALMKEKKYDPIYALSFEVDLYYMTETWLHYSNDGEIEWFYASSLVDTGRLIGIMLDFLKKDYGIEKETVSIRVEPFELQDTPQGFRDWMHDLEASGVYTPPAEAPIPKRKKEKRTMELNEKMEAVRGEIQALVGANEFKALCDELLTVASELKKNNTANCLMHQTYLFSINDGYGYTTALGYLRELYLSLDVLKMKRLTAVTRISSRSCRSILPNGSARSRKQNSRCFCIAYPKPRALLSYSACPLSIKRCSPPCEMP